MSRIRIDIDAVRVALGPEGKPRARSTVYRKLEADPSFPRPISDGYRLQWYEDEITDWIASLPRRQYRGNHEEAAAAP